MKTGTDILLLKLAYLLHRGLVEIRNLTHQGRDQQIHDLADALEPLSALFANEEDDSTDTIRDHLAPYQARYAGRTFDYLAILGMPDLDFVENFRRW